MIAVFCEPIAISISSRTHEKMDLSLAPQVISPVPLQHPVCLPRGVLERLRGNSNGMNFLQFRFHFSFAISHIKMVGTVISGF
jgi:hypothetical protein